MTDTAEPVASMSTDIVYLYLSLSHFICLCLYSLGPILALVLAYAKHLCLYEFIGSYIVVCVFVFVWLC